MSNEKTLTDQVEESFYAVVAALHVGLEATYTLPLIKEYANAFAQFQLGRVETALHTKNYFSAARAVAEQAEILKALERAS